MDFQLDESQRLIVQVASDFCARVLTPLARDIDRKEAIPAAVLRELASLGLCGVNVPLQLGGSEAGVIAYSLAMTEIARGCASTAVTMAVTNMVAEVITKFGTPAQSEGYVPRLCDGSLAAGAFALSESEAGSDPGAMRTTARREGDTWVLDGSKQWITSGTIAGVFVVWARTGLPGTRGISAFLVDAGTRGLTIGKHEDKLGLRGSSTTELHFEDCRIPESALLGEIDRGFIVAMMALDGGRIGIASQALGIAEAALSEAIEYAKERKTFGRSLESHQAIQFMIADSRMDLDASRLLTLRAAAKKEKGEPFSREAAMAKLWSSEAANRVCDRALQIHGGYGYVKDSAVERHYRDVRVTRIYEGASEIQRIVISRAQLS